MYFRSTYVSFTQRKQQRFYIVYSRRFRDLFVNANLANPKEREAASAHSCPIRHYNFLRNYGRRVRFFRNDKQKHCPKKNVKVGRIVGAKVAIELTFNDPTCVPSV